MMLLALLTCEATHRRELRQAETIGPLISALYEAGPLPTPWIGRLSVPTAVAACGRGSQDAFDGLSCAATTITPPSPEVLAVGALAAQSLTRRIDPDAIHAAAIVDLVSDDPAGNTLDRSISMFEMVTRLNPRSARAFVDLSAAYLLRASRRRDTPDLLRAADAAGRAIEMDATNEAAQFNRALALEILGVDGEARKGWRALVTKDSTSWWGSEAQRRLDGRSMTVMPGPPKVTAGRTALSVFAGDWPTQARNFVWEQLLRDWARAVLAADSTQAAARLEGASVVASVLAERYRDSSITGALRAVRRVARDSVATRKLAVAHERFARAHERARSGDFRVADSGFMAVLAAAPPSMPLRHWSTFGHGNALIYHRRPDEAERMIRALFEHKASALDAPLAARALSVLGVLRLRHGRTESGLEAVRAAGHRFGLLGERENLGAMISVEGEVMLLGGDKARGYATLHRALLEFRPFPTSVWRHNALFLLSRAAAAEGLTSVAAALEDEDAVVASASGLPESVAEFRLTRARALWARGRVDDGREAIAAAARAIDTIRLPDARAQFRAELSFTIATGPLHEKPREAHALLDSVVAFFRPLRSPAKLIPAYLARAEAALELGRLAAAEADLDSAATLYDPRRRQIAGIPEQALLLARARSVFDRLVMVRLRSGRVSDALEALERGRLSFSPIGESSVGVERPNKTGHATTVDYAVIGDTLLLWVIHGRDTTAYRSVIERGQLPAVVERTRVALELGASEDVVRPELSQLYEWLFRPIESRLGDANGSVTVVADDEIADVPFAALYDRGRGSYLVEHYTVRFSPTLRESHRRRSVRPPRNVLLVASPILDRRTFPNLPPLLQAQAEVRVIAPLYDRPTLLVGTDADSASIEGALRSAELFHFAGHAVFDDVRPERSLLAIPPRGLTAARIGMLDLRQLRLAVLSACETTRSPGRRSNGFVGLTDAFLAAGAGGVVGSLWRVDDVHADSLMRAFHRAYRTSFDAADALRVAQRTMLRSLSPALRSPAAWAGFRYVGQ
jgi:CHAT domain-containing protein